MQELVIERYHQLRDGASVLAFDPYGDKVLKLKDGTMLKLFRLKRFYSSARWLPYSKRFERNVQLLHDRAIPTVSVLHCYNIPEIGRTAIHYAPLEGLTLREIHDQNADGLGHQLIEKTAQFIQGLHAKGIYFRSLHLGNIIVGSDQHLGLIDVADMRFYRKALRPALIRRNFQHLFRYVKDVKRLGAIDHDLFIKSYLHYADLSQGEKASLFQKLKSALPNAA